MSQGIQLVSLRCPECNADFKTADKTVFLYCSGCGSGFEVNEEQLVKVPVYFAIAGQTEKSFLPFWAFDARLQLTKREAKGLLGHHQGLIRVFEQRQVIRFYTPAFMEDLDGKRPRALDLTYRQPELQFVQRQPDLPRVVISQTDARKIADYLFITSEVEQPDTVRNITYRLDLDNPCLIAISF